MSEFRNKTRTVPLEAFIAMVNGGTTSSFFSQKFKEEANRQNSKKPLRRRESILNSMNTLDRSDSVTFDQRTRDDIQFMPWQCVALFRKNLSTLDFILKNRKDLMAFLSVLGYRIYGEDAHHDFIS